MTRTLLPLTAALLLVLCACSSRQAATPESTASTPAPQTSSAPQASSTPAESGGSQADSDTGAGQDVPAASSSPLALPSSSRWKVGVNYTMISPAQPISAPPGKVQVMEMFWLACPHCHALEPYIRAWRKSKPDYVQFVRVPVMWGPVQRAHARLYYTLEALGRDDLVEKAFDLIHNLETQTGSESIMVGSTQANTMKMQQAFAVKNGVSASAFASAYNSFDVDTQLQQAEQLDKTYEIDSVPTIIIDGRYRTDVVKAQGENQLIELINFLTKWDHEHLRSGA